MSTTVSPENWIKEITKAEGITLIEGEYVAGQIVVGVFGGDFNKIERVDSIDDAQLVFVLRDAVTVGVGEIGAGVGVLGTFKATGLTFIGTQTAEAIAGALAGKGIFLTTMMEA